MQNDELTLLDQSMILAVEEELGADTCEYLLSLFIDELKELGNKLPDAIANKEQDSIRDIAHILKNSASVYGAIRLAEAARQFYDDKSLSVKQTLQAAQHIHELCLQTTAVYQSFTKQASN